MNDHEKLLRSLLVERYTPYPAPALPTPTPQQVSRTIAHEKRRPKPPPARRPPRPDPTIDDARRTT